MSILPPNPEQQVTQQWNMQYVDVDMFTRVCIVQTSISGLQVIMQLTPDDAIRVGKKITECGERAKTDLAHAQGIPDEKPGSS